MYKFSPFLFLQDNEERTNIYNAYNGFICSITDINLRAFFKTYWQKSTFYDTELPMDIFKTLINSKCIVPEDYKFDKDELSQIENIFSVKDSFIIAIILTNSNKYMTIKNFKKALTAIENFTRDKKIERLHIQLHIDSSWNEDLNVLDSFINYVYNSNIELTITLYFTNSVNIDLAKYLKSYLMSIELRIDYKTFKNQINTNYDIMTFINQNINLFNIHFLCSVDEKLELDQLDNVSNSNIVFDYIITRENKDNQIYTDCFLSEYVKLEELKEQNKNSISTSWMKPLGLVCQSAYDWYFIIDYNLKIKKCIEHLDEESNNIGFINDAYQIILDNQTFMFDKNSVLSSLECINCNILPLCYRMNCPWKVYIERESICPIKKSFVNDYLAII